MAAMESRRGYTLGSGRSFLIELMASTKAIIPPVMLAVRVPPSACRTSQSTVIWRAPSASRFATARRLRPMSRWISVVRPSTLDRSLRFLGLVLPGSILYSAVIHPFSEFRIQGGTSSETLAVQRTTVPPLWYRTLPGVWFVNLRFTLTGRISLAFRVMVF